MTPRMQPRRNGAVAPRDTADTQKNIAKRYQGTPCGIHCRSQLMELFSPIGKVRAMLIPM